jgi:hypothetical protein
MSVTSRVSWIEMVSFHPQCSWEFCVSPLNVIPLLHELPVVRLRHWDIYIHPGGLVHVPDQFVALCVFNQGSFSFSIQAFRQVSISSFARFFSNLFVIVACNPFVAFGILTWKILDSKFTLVEERRSRRSRPYKNSYCTRSLLERASSRLWWPTTYRWFNI